VTPTSGQQAPIEAEPIEASPAEAQPVESVEQEPERQDRPERDRSERGRPERDRPERDRPERERPERDRAPELPEDAALSLLDSEVRNELRGLPKNLAEIVGRHLAAAGMLIDEDPESALKHARYARAKANRVALVREAVGLTAYQAGEWAEALSELRAARRMSNGPGHISIMADCERALGRPERALELIKEGLALDLPHEEAIEARIVGAGARRDMGQLDAAVIALQIPELDPKRREPWSAGLFYAYADNLAAAGRTEEAIRWFLNAAQADDEGQTDAAERAVELSDPGQVPPITQEDEPPPPEATQPPQATEPPEAPEPTEAPAEIVAEAEPVDDLR
jgi:tetratricopeptide (TPR) repeat protein